MCRRGTRRRACCCRCGRPAGCRAVGRRVGAGRVAALPPGRRHSYDDDDVRRRRRRRSRFLRAAAAARMRTSFHSKRTHTRGARTAARVVLGRIARSRLSRRPPPPPPSVSHRTSDTAVRVVCFIFFKFFFYFCCFRSLPFRFGVSRR